MLARVPGEAVRVRLSAGARGVAAHAAVVAGPHTAAGVLLAIAVPRVGGVSRGDPAGAGDSAARGVQRARVTGGLLTGAVPAVRAAAVPAAAHGLPTGLNRSHVSVWWRG